MSNQQEPKQQAAQRQEAAAEVQFRRLSVNKETITDLDVPDAERVRGGTNDRCPPTDTCFLPKK